MTLRIGLVSTAASPVAAEGAHSVESLLHLLCREYVALGHHVVLFACACSRPPPGVELVPTLPGDYAHPDSPQDWQMADWVTLCRAVEHSLRLDLLHSHVYLAGLPLTPLARCPLLHTLHVMPGDLERSLLAMYPAARFTALSAYQYADLPTHRPAAVIPHGVDLADFTLCETPEDYLVWLGRFIPGKGALDAITLARRVGLPLLLAGPRNDYYDAEIAPHVDESSVRYVGPVDRRQRDTLLGNARALLYTLRTPEPFGLVQVEALLCGTPVVAPALGAIPEIVDHALTGQLYLSPDALPADLNVALSLPRAEIRRRAESRFSARRMATRYLDLYTSLLARTPDVPAAR